MWLTTRSITHSKCTSYFSVYSGTQFSSVQFSRSVVSDCLWPHGLQYIRLPCPSPTPRACSNSSPLSRWCHPTISSPVIPFFCLQSFSASGSFLSSQFFASGGQCIGVSASASVLPVNIQDWFPLGLTWWKTQECNQPTFLFSRLWFDHTWISYFYPCWQKGCLALAPPGKPSHLLGPD